MKKHTLVALMAFLTFSVATITGCKKEKETTACISTTTTTFNTGQSVAFTSCSKESGTYTWQFGDGTTSSLENPSHVYTSSGTYEVVLTVSGPNGTDSTSSGWVSCGSVSAQILSLSLLAWPNSSLTWS